MSSIVARLDTSTMYACAWKRSGGAGFASVVVGWHWLSYPALLLSGGIGSAGVVVGGASSPAQHCCGWVALALPVIVRVVLPVDEAPDRLACPAARFGTQKKEKFGA